MNYRLGGDLPISNRDVSSQIERQGLQAVVYADVRIRLVIRQRQYSEIEKWR